MPSLEVSETNLELTGARDASSPARGLDGLRILIVEDNPYIAMALEDMLSEQGLVIAGVAGNLDDALLLAASASLDLALLDVNLGDKKIDPVAEALVARGTPFIFTTGCGRAGLPESFLDRPIVEKPFYIEEILQTLRAVFGANPTPGLR
jgi:DNA-binding response OmpR family regulator